MDNHHVSISPMVATCAAIQLSSLGESACNTAYAVANYLYHPSRGQPASIVVWSDLAGTESRGGVLANFMDEIDQFISALPNIENPKTGNIITFYSMMVDHEKFKEWYKAERIARLKKL